ncbi:hypothetical protein [Cupriavidus basilensis]|uniref:outer membrane lipoprotein n=1 Tax=Cupriavidus basilensis TaxID=68895 RepID=UPI0039F6FEC1
MIRTFSIAFFVALCALASGCATQQTSPNVYRTSEALRKGDIEMVTVVRVRQVTITGNDGMLSASSGLPGMIGAGLSALLGARTIGGGNGRYLVGALSGAAGGFVSQQVAEHVSKRAGLEVIVRTDNGRQLAITQDADQQFNAGDRVYLVAAGNGYRLTR